LRVRRRLHEDEQSTEGRATILIKLMKTVTEVGGKKKIGGRGAAVRIEVGQWAYLHRRMPRTWHQRASIHGWGSHLDQARRRIEELQDQAMTGERRDEPLLSRWGKRANQRGEEKRGVQDSSAGRRQPKRICSGRGGQQDAVYLGEKKGRAWG